MRVLPVACLSIAAAALGAAPPDEPAPPNRIGVAVDPRVELMSLIFRLAGNPEYNQRSAASPYADAVETRFGPHRDHAVVETARRLRARHGVSYDAVMSMAVHLTDTVELGERIPFDAQPERLDARWRVEDARLFLEQARDFVRVTGFNEFTAGQRPFYEKAAARLRAPIEEQDYVGWFDGFFGERGGATFRASVGLLNGGGSYGVGIRFPDGTEEITPVIGASRFDGEGLPVFGKGVAGTIVHELCHSYTNPIVDRYAGELERPARRIYRTCAAQMRRQAYGNWRTVMYESLVRACTVRFAQDTRGAAAGRRAIEYEEGRGFVWVGELAALLEEYDGSRERYPALDDFMPRIVEFFEDYAQRFGDDP